MLRPSDLLTTDYDTATKPTLGYEQQLWVSTGQSLDLATVTVAAPNSGVLTKNVGANAALVSAPMELMAQLKNDVDCGGQNLVITVNGTDQTDVALTATATFAAPAYAQEQGRVFPKGWAVEVIPPVDGKKFKTILSITVTSASSANGTAVEIFGVPSVSSFVLVGCKVRMDYDLKVPMPYPVQCGRNMSAFVKPGEIPVGSATLTGKVPTFGDGLARYNGRRVTGLIVEKKEDKLKTMHIFLLGMIATSKVANGESTDPTTLDANVLYEEAGVILAS